MPQDDGMHAGSIDGPALVGYADLPAWAAHALLESIVDRFDLDVNRTWWWDELTGDITHLPYDGDGLAAVADTIRGWGVVVLVVTEASGGDDGGPPATYVLRETDIIDALSEAPFFEYALVSPDFATIVFDTHHNQLVIKRVTTPAAVQ